MPNSEILNPTKLVVPFVQTPLRCNVLVSVKTASPTPPLTQYFALGRRGEGGRVFPLC